MATHECELALAGVCVERTYFTSAPLSPARPSYRAMPGFRGRIILSCVRKEENQNALNSPSDWHLGNILASGNDCCWWWSSLGPWHPASECVGPALPRTAAGSEQDTFLHVASLKLPFIRRAVGVFWSIAETPSMRPTTLVTSSAMRPSNIQQGKINSWGNLISLFCFSLRFWTRNIG